MVKKDLIHSRNITVNTYEVGENELLIEGTLKDDRFFPSYFYSANKFIDPGTIHHMIIRLTLSLPSLLITSAESEMREVPNEICHEVEGVVQKLVGIQIRRGFTHKIRDMIGGVAGCLHLTNLILAIGSAAVQGQWAYYSRKRDGQDNRVPETDMSLLMDSCWLWREDGPYYERIVEMKKEQKKSR